jgi:hypothetical protein
MFGVCSMGDTAHVNMIFMFLPHTHHGCIDILIQTLVSPSGKNVNYNEKQLSGKKIFELFLLYVQVS